MGLAQLCRPALKLSSLNANEGCLYYRISAMVVRVF